MCHTQKPIKFHSHPKQHIEDNKMAEAKGLSTPVNMKSELARSEERRVGKEC